MQSYSNQSQLPNSRLSGKKPGILVIGTIINCLRASKEPAFPVNFGEIPCEIEPGIPGQEPGHLGKLTGSRRGKLASAAISAVPGMRAG